MGKIPSWAVLSSMKVGDVPVYRLVPKNAKKLTESEFLAILSQKVKQSPEEARYWLDCFREVLFGQLSENTAVDLGFLFSKLYIGGTIASLADQPTKQKNPVLPRIYFKNEFSERFKQYEVVNETLTVNAILYEVMQDGASDLNRIESATARIVANLNEGKIDPTQPDNGVWLENPRTDVKVCEASISYSDSSTCYFTFPELPESGKYRLVIATRNGKNPDEYGLAKLTRNVFVLNEEVSNG